MKQKGGLMAEMRMGKSSSNVMLDGWQEKQSMELKGGGRMRQNTTVQCCAVQIL